ncbi:MAG: efflux RND transporter periplasmic adaptor subunit, partial [Lentisphaerae bacterium]|nr:efflux RND transporter periplasmic adaptor subunit [Lentisphaerota bacterium]
TRDVHRAQAEAAQDVAKAGVELSARKVEQAEAALGIARKNLADATVVAPIGGVVTRRVAEPGEHMAVGNTVMRIEDLATKEAVAFLPAIYHAEIRAGETKFRLALNGRDGGEHVVTYRGPTVDTTLRTFEVKGRIPEEQVGVVPGDLAQLTIVFASRQGVGVPAEAVLYRRGRNLVFVVEDGKAVAREVETGLANDGWLEIVSGLEPGEQVVVEGQVLLTDGDLVSVL